MRLEVQQIFQEGPRGKGVEMGMAPWDYMNDVVLKLQMGMDDCDLDPGRNGNTMCCVYCVGNMDLKERERKDKGNKVVAQCTVLYCVVLYCQTGTVP